MTNANRDNLKFQTALTVKHLAALENKGYKYLQVKGFTMDHHPEYVEPHYIMLVPIKELSADPAKKGIYEPINSNFLQEWANDTNRQLDVFLATNERDLLS